MAKKTFKDNTAHLDRFFSETEQELSELQTQEADKTHETHSTYDQKLHIQTQEQTTGQSKPSPKYYRFNLKMALEYKEYLAHESWKAHKTITEYINDLIQADMDSKDIRNT